jgi:predicted transcriptional regulator
LAHGKRNHDSLSYGQDTGIDIGITICHTLIMKTAISIPDTLFNELQETANKQHRSRSELFTIAVKEYLDRIKSQSLLSSLDEVYSEPEESQDMTLRQKGKRYYSRKLTKESY